MKKEMILAIFLGLVLGLIVTYGIYTARQSLTDSGGISTEGSPEPISETQAALHNAITLLSPEEGSVYTTPEVKIIGTTDPLAQVIIMLNDKPFILESDSSGNFSVEDTLRAGANFVVVRAIDEEGNIATMERTIAYTTVDFDQPIPASPSATATASASPKATPKPATKPATSSGVPR